LVSGAGVQLGFEYPSLVDAIEKAGGMTLAADIRNISIRRPQSNGSEVVIKINLWTFIAEGNSNQNITLRDGDSIFIPPTEKPNFKETLTLINTNLAPDLNTPRTVTVVGQVYNPGAYVVLGGTTTADSELYRNTEGLPTLTRAIQLAGGIKPDADVRQIQLQRLTRTGLKQTIQIDLWQLLQGDLSQNTLVQEGDTIVVPESVATSPAETTKLAAANFSPATIKVAVIGEVNNRNLGIVNVPPNTSLNQALQIGGGFTSRSYKKSVTLIRLNPDGTILNREIKIDFSEGINEETNPLLRNNDIIVIDRSGLAVYADNANLLLSPMNELFTLLRTLEVLGILQ
jgi:polysaccharide export outer membrane protein